MPKFRKKPVVIEASQWFPGVEHPGVHSKKNGRAYVITVHEQKAFLEPGDWILPGPKEGRFYPCKPDIFAATYDPLSQQPEGGGEG